MAVDVPSGHEAESHRRNLKFNTNKRAEIGKYRELRWLWPQADRKLQVTQA